MAYELYQSRHKGYEIDNLLDDVVDLNTDVAALKTEYDANKVKMSDGTILPLYLVNTYATKTELSAKADSTQVAADIATATTDMATNTGVASAIATATTDMATNTGVASAIATATTDMATNTSVASDIATATADMATNTSVAAAIAAAAYTLPEATTSTLGGVKPDGTTITVDSDGTIHGTGGGGGSGHTIIDSDGTSMTTRAGLQFASDLNTSDDSTNNKTIVTPHELSNAEIAEIISELPLNPASTYVPNCGFTPVGTIISVMGNSAPANYLECNGEIYNIIQYPVLAKYFKDQFGSENYFGGNGTTTFAVPDLRGEFLRGTGINSYANQGDGSAVGEHQDGTQIPSMYAFTATNDATKGSVGGYLPSSATANYFNFMKNPDFEETGSGNAKYVTPTTVTVGTSTAKKGYAYTARPTNTSVLYCIAYQNIYVDAKNDYSTTEKIVGTWINGKPLYQITIEGVMPNVATDGTYVSTNVQHNIPNIDMPFIVESFVLDYSDWPATSTLVRRLPYTTNAGYQLKASIGRALIQYASAIKAYNGSKVYTTIQYTKTTD